jgi:hypothetical protein
MIDPYKCTCFSPTPKHSPYLRIPGTSLFINTSPCRYTGYMHQALAQWAADVSEAERYNTGDQKVAYDASASLAAAAK